MKKEKILKIAIFVVVLLIPIIYSFFYLKSYWNPYGTLSDMKIAVVNLDNGKDNKNQGKEFVQSLKDSATFNICEVSKENANDGMEKGDYYATIEIPENFTECLESGSTTDKQIAQITYRPNQATNYLATQIVNSAVKTIELNLQSKVDREIIANLANKLNEVPDSLQSISDGAGTILDGSQSLNDGIKQLSDGTAELSSSYKQFDNGVESAYTGSKDIQNGLTQVSDGVSSLQNGGKTLDNAISQINSGVDELSSQGSSGIASLSSGITTLNDGANQVNSGASQVNEGTLAYVENVENLNANVEAFLEKASALSQSPDPTLKALGTNAIALLGQDSETNLNNFQKLTYAGKTLTDGTNNLYMGTQTLYEGTQKLSAGTQDLGKITSGIQSLKSALTQVKQGTVSLNQGISTLASGTNQLSDGSSTLTNGLSTLNSSSKTIDNALTTLNNGTSSAYEGSNQLVSGVQTFKTTIDEGLENTKEQLKSLNGFEDFGAKPVEFKTEAYGEVNSYGIAFTPLFLCIGLWVGALMSYVVLYYDQKHRFNIFDHDYKNKILQNIAYIGLGALQGLIVGLLLKLGLGYDVQNTALYYTASILVGITFVSIIQFLIRNFGDIGKFLALIVLVLQLAASGGTFPIETIDKGFQAITSYLPMTYSIKLFREILVPTATNFKAQYLGILVAITFITLIITCIVDLVKKQKQTEKVDA